FDSAGLVPSDVQSLEDLRALPPLEKRELQKHRDDMVARNWAADDLVLNQTGGSTGTPVAFYLSRERIRTRTAATWRHNAWAGWNVGDPVALLWGAPRDGPAPGWRARLRNRLLDRQLFLDTGHITEEGLAGYHAALKRFRPKVVLAYARSAVLFARYLEARGLEAYRPRSLVTSAEVLTAEERELLQRVFGC